MELIVGETYTLRCGIKGICKLSEDQHYDYEVYFTEHEESHTRTEVYYHEPDYKDGVWWYKEEKVPFKYDIVLADQIDLDVLLKEADEVLEEYLKTKKIVLTKKTHKVRVKGLLNLSGLEEIIHINKRTLLSGDKRYVGHMLGCTVMFDLETLEEPDGWVEIIEVIE